MARYILPLILGALLLAACGRAEPLAQATPTANPADVAPTLTAAEIAALPSATPADAGVVTPSPSGATATPAAAGGTYVPEPVPPGSFDRLRFLLPADMDAYIVADPELARASRRGFGVGLIPTDLEPSPKVTIVIAGGEEAWPEWYVQQSPSNPTTPVTVRGAPGTLVDDGLAMRLVWEEDGNAYFVMAPHGATEDVLAFAETLAAHDRAAWQKLVHQPTADAGAGPLRYLLPPAPEGYRVTSEDETAADRDGFYVMLTPIGEEPGPFTTITIAGGAPAAPIWEANQPTDEPGALIEPITVRGVAGTFTSSGLGAAVAWVEGGRPYYVNHPGPDTTAILAFVEALEPHDLANWQAAMLPPR